MHTHLVTAGTSNRPSLPLRLGRLGLLLLPITLLVTVSLRSNGSATGMLWLGALFPALACVLALFSRQGWREPTGPAVIMLYVIALCWVLLAATGMDDWFVHLSQALLLVVPLVFFAGQCLYESGAPALRRARLLAARLAARTEWPANLADCRSLPEVKALREALHFDASPALNLLTNPRPQVRVAALTALEYRQNWRAGQPQIVLHLAQRMKEPDARAAAVNALANTDDRNLIESLSEFLLDPSPLVRQTATEALLWNTEARWPWVRLSLRAAMAHPACQADGPLYSGGTLFCAEAVADLTAWCAEKGLLSLRAAQTLGVHYNQALTAGHDPKLVAELCRQLGDPHSPAMLRLELARVLHHHRELEGDVLRQTLDPSTPAPVRLIAVEVLMSKGNSSEAIAALRELARLPNREIALATADVVQRRLGVPLGLTPEQPLPAVHSRLAAEVARKLLSWATQHEALDPEGALQHDDAFN